MLWTGTVVAEVHFGTGAHSVYLQATLLVVQSKDITGNSNNGICNGQCRQTAQPEFEAINTFWLRRPCACMVSRRGTERLLLQLLV